MKRSYYQVEIKDFIREDIDLVFGKLARNHQHDLEDLQKKAWIQQIRFLKENLINVEGNIYFEFSIPRMGKRVDNILLINNIIFVLEFKVGEDKFTKEAQNQTIDYCLDLLNFHEESHNKSVIPILIATKGPNVVSNIQKVIELEECILCNEKNFKNILQKALREIKISDKLNVDKWNESRYKPTPTIIEAAQALYKGHNVKDISRSDAGAINLYQTSLVINKIIDDAKIKKQKSICFLTGVPGAGKTLAGLNIANERLKSDESEHAVFLSGNGPLVDVLREALIRDSIKVAKFSSKKLTRTDATREAKAFIQNIHHFRDDNLETYKAPIEKVVIFDEAQRAWKKEQVSKFMKTKKGIDNFEMSEPEYLISVMNRHEDWCTIICLIGGGQEINTGEAGISEWLYSLKNNFNDWNIYYSNKILSDSSTYLDNIELIDWLKGKGKMEVGLHLEVSLRSFRSEQVSLFVQYVLANQSKKAIEVYTLLKDNYPIVLTRNLSLAKDWLKKKSKGSERIGLIASSGARRLKNEGINVKNEIKPADWFLNDMNDVRSSYYLEDIATEFDIQGLEIDYTCVAWDINLYYTGNNWNYQSFKGAKWQKIIKIIY